MNRFITHIYFAFVFSLALIQSQAVEAQVQKLSLQEAVTLSLANNPELKASHLEVEKAGQQTVISRSLYLPTVSATAFANHYFQRPVFFGFGEGSTDGKITYGKFGGEDQGGAALTAIQPIFNPLALSTVKRSKLKEQESKILLSGKQTQIVSDVKQTYLQLLVLNERIKLQEQSLQRNRRVLQDSRLLLLQGKALRVDTLRAYTAMRNLEPDLVKLTFAVETGKLRLRSLIGVDSLQSIVLTDSLVIPAPASLPLESDVYEIARKNNPDYQRLSLQEQLDDYQTRQSSAARLPVVSLVGQYQVQTQTNNLEYSNASYPSTSFVGVQVSVPIFNGFSTTARVRQSQFNQEQSSLRLKDANDRLRADVHAVVADCNESVARIHTTKTVTETAKLSFDIVQYRYARGVASRLELTDAELALTQAQSNYLEAVYDYLAARIALFSLMGTVEATEK
jgi:outer membrane protein TolC